MGPFKGPPRRESERLLGRAEAPEQQQVVEARDHRRAAEAREDVLL